MTEIYLAYMDVVSGEIKEQKTQSIKNNSSRHYIPLNNILNKRYVDNKFVNKITKPDRYAGYVIIANDEETYYQLKEELMDKRIEGLKFLIQNMREDLESLEKKLEALENGTEDKPKEKKSKVSKKKDEIVEKKEDVKEKVETKEEKKSRRGSKKEDVKEKVETKEEKVVEETTKPEAPAEKKGRSSKKKNKEKEEEVDYTTLKPTALREIIIKKGGIPKSRNKEELIEQLKGM